MLKERDKKLLFYSWSYAILAASLIYACCGYGALAYTQIQQYTVDNGASYEMISALNQGTNKLGWSTTTANVTYITITGMEATRTDGTFPIEGSQEFDLKSGTTVVGSGIVTWHIGGSSMWPTKYAASMEITVNWDSANASSRTLNGFSLYRKGTASLLSSYMSSLVFREGTVHSGNDNIWLTQPAAGSPSGLTTIYSGTALPDAPVINDFTKDASCYAPGEAIVLESNVTGSVDSWLWEIYDSSDVSVWSSTDSVETIVDENFAPGLYQVQLYVENTGGNDFLSKDNWLNITQAGTCTPINNWTNPFPTQVTTIPTQQFYETMTMPPHIVTNMSGINEEINKGLFANMSQGYRDYIDYVAEQANTTFTGTFRTLLSPVTLVVNSISGAIGLFSTAINSLTVYTTVPLAITAIVINYMPWQIVTLITAGIAIDAILIIILGR